MTVYVDMLKWRDTIKNIVAGEIKKKNLLPRYGIVKGPINHASNTVNVLFNGTEDNPDLYIPVIMNSVHPVAVGDTVRIDGAGSDQFISEVITPRHVYLSIGTLDADGVIISTLPTITGGVALVWDAATGRIGKA